MKNRISIIAFAIVLACLMPSASTGNEWVYAIAGSSLLRANLDGTGAEVVTSHSNPHCGFWDFQIHASGAPYLVTQCTTPIENTVIRLRPDYVWEELLRYGASGTAFLSIALSAWLTFDVLYYARFDEIRLMTLDRSLDIQIVSGTQVEDILALDVDASDDRIYWVQTPRNPDVRQGRIMRAGRLRQNDAVETFVSIAGSRPNDVAVDEKSRMVYWSVPGEGIIQRASVMNGQDIETVLTGLNAPTAVAIHAASQKLYWTDEFGIRRSDLDGTQVENLLALPGTFAYRIGFAGDLLVGIKGAAWGQLKRLYR